MGIESVFWLTITITLFSLFVSVICLFDATKTRRGYRFLLDEKVKCDLDLVETRSALKASRGANNSLTAELVIVKRDLESALRVRFAATERIKTDPDLEQRWESFGKHLK